MNRRTLFSLIPLFGAVGLLMACLSVLNSGGPARAASLHQGDAQAPAFRALTVTASIPVSDTCSYQGVTKTVYFNNNSPGIITLTVYLTGTPPLTLTTGAAFGEGERAYTATDSPATFIVTYAVKTTDGNQPGILYTATRGDGLEATIAITFIQDITAPTTAIVTPSTDLWISTTLQITGTAADNEGGSGLAEVQVTTGTAWVAPDGLATWAYTWTPPSGQNGVAYTFVISAVDFVKNAATATRHITVDNIMTGTVSGLTSTTHLTGVWSNRATITVTWDPADDGPGIGLGGYAVLWDLFPLTVPSPTLNLDGSASATSTTLGEGDSHYFHIRAVDALGNWAESTAHLGPFKADNKSPEVQISYPSPGAILTTTHQPTVVITGTAYDPPPSSDVAWVDVTTGTAWVSATGTANWSYTWTLPLVDRQVYTLTARAYDNAGNLGLSANVPVTLDTVAPTATAPISHKASWVTSTVIYTWLASADNSGIAGYRIHITNTGGYSAVFPTASPILTFTQALSEGRGYFARVLAVDGVGNIGPWSGPSTVVTPDLSPPQISNPQISVGSGVTYFYVSGLTLFYTNTMPNADSFTVKGNASDAGPSGLAKATFSTAFGQTPSDDTDPAAFSGSYDVSPGATESGHITVTLYDRAGNFATQTYTYTLDGEGPYTGSVVIQGGAAYVSGTAVSLSLLSADAGCGVAQMCMTNTLALCNDWRPYTTTLANWNLDGSLDGIKTIYAWFKDHLGNASRPYTDTVILDRLAPSGSITIDNGAAYATQVTVTLSLTATDATSGLADQPMRFSSDGTTWSAWETFSVTKRWTLDDTSDGPKTVYAQFWDRAGNVATYSDTIFLDRRPPLVTVTAPLTSPVPFVVAWEATDQGSASGVVSYSVAYSVTGWVPWFLSTTLTNATFYTATPGQTVVFSVTAYDRAGNPGTGYARVYVDYHRVYIPLVLRNWVWWYQYDRYEPNDSPAQAYGPLSSGQVITAYIWDATDRDDYYWIQPSQSTPVTVTLTNIPANCDFDLYVYYYDQGRYQQVAYSNKSGNADEGVTFNATANTKYYIRVYPYQGSNNTQGYRLFVRWQ